MYFKMLDGFIDPQMVNSLLIGSYSAPVGVIKSIGLVRAVKEA